jgi:sugar lactone lactonase YvrE
VSAISYPSGVAVDSTGDLYISDHGDSRIRKVSSGVITTVAGIGPCLAAPCALSDGGPAISAQLFGPIGIAVDSAGNLYIADTDINRIRKVSNGVIATVAGNGIYAVGGFGGDNGPATSAQSFNPQGVAVDTAGNIYIADTVNHCVRKVSNGVITTVAGGGELSIGDNGPATSAQLNSPTNVAVDASGNLFIADWGNNRVRKVSNGVITTVAGNGTACYTGDNGPATRCRNHYSASGGLDTQTRLPVR